MPSWKSCRARPASSSTSASAVAPCCDHSRAIAACSARTGRRSARRSSCGRAARIAAHDGGRRRPPRCAPTKLPDESLEPGLPEPLTLLDQTQSFAQHFTGVLVAAGVHQALDHCALLIAQNHVACRHGMTSDGPTEGLWRRALQAGPSPGRGWQIMPSRRFGPLALAHSAGGWHWTWVATGACSLAGLALTATIARALRR